MVGFPQLKYINSKEIQLVVRPTKSFNEEMLVEGDKEGLSLRRSIGGA